MVDCVAGTRFVLHNDGEHKEARWYVNSNDDEYLVVTATQNVPSNNGVVFVQNHTALKFFSAPVRERMKEARRAATAWAKKQMGETTNEKA